MPDQSNPQQQHPSGEWVTVAHEPDQLTAEILVNFLRQSAIPARTDAGDTMSFLGPSILPTRVMVPIEWERDARIAIDRRGWDEELPPGIRH